MDDNKPWEKLEPTFSLVEDRLRILRQTLPEAFTDGKINFETLKELLGEAIADDEQDEHFGLSWTGKREARKLAGMPSKGTLVPVKGKGLHEDTTENIFIEGDNLEVLKLLHKSYYGKIKMIYIDPPYNTGNDFIYKDDYKMPLESYLQRSGQMNELDEMLTSNPKSSGRFHSDWLNMIYPRLRVAKDLLRDNGAIFVSIDDNEVHNLRQLMNEIFGEENFIGNIIWKHTQQSKNDERYFSRHYNSLVCYRSSDNLKEFRFERTEENNKNYSNPDNDPKGFWRSGDVRSPNYRKTLCFDIITPSGKKIPSPANGWRWSEDSVTEKIKTGEIIFVDNETRIIRKIYLSEQNGRTPENVWDGEEFGTTRKANSELKELFDGFVFFDTPKPVDLIKKASSLFVEDKDFIALDFFAGSGTTAQAVMELNKDGGKRKFVIVQIDEKIKEDSEAYKAGFRTISEITAERIRRASKKIESEIDAGLSLSQKPDLGFKFYRLERSNFKAWEDIKENDLGKLQKQIELFAESSSLPNATKDGILTEILLLEGFPLNSKIEPEENFERNTVWRVSSEFLEHRLFITLDEEIWEETIDDAKELESNDIFICPDKSLESPSKIRLSDVCRLKVI